MNHYELIYIVNPQQAKESKLFDKCKEQISSVSGVLHRSEDIGLRDLSYQIDDCTKGHYFLLNFECQPENLKEIENLFKFNESILRSSIVKKRKAESETSALMTQTKDQSSSSQETTLESVKKEAEVKEEKKEENKASDDSQEQKQNESNDSTEDK
ncbi:MAG: 30S ribosomal protein S6 [Gammaproteobacteria bacterium TMED222]|nr:MAG: 30S ribosomal protein S6 [Gammaproteobacteria bacterium TMED222]